MAMATTTATEKFDDLAEAEQLYRNFASYGRLFASVLRTDNLYDVDVVPVEDLKDPNFRFIHEWYGPDREAVTKEIQHYNAHLRRRAYRCITALKLFQAISEAITSDNQERKEAVRALASHLRGRRGVRCPSNLGWLLWRLQRLHEWDDHDGMADMVDRMDSISGSIVSAATNAKRLKWSNLLAVELSQR